MISKPDDLPSDLVSALAALQAERGARQNAEVKAASWQAQAANALAELSDNAALIAHLELLRVPADRDHRFQAIVITHSRAT
ncbi:hypothetical protein HU230_0042280 (plasmid) [Bradyrhizobium quebecense]|uniref:Uncharacterized protein n=1 Tax=Bradyrhizobium quebecense TaxID=2748629 RepID=A0A973WVW3_9BRAD|nr:hypothetical protein [Bradyrhizobium quebecense]UGA48883.1 hypothetical protein HU230_0042280 [Bradyrhizobium quebecense]